eukprot:gb/GECH01013899.1/.p1 GENE.gb/GECH01013899.1/~~gb/GECH01013899.1/.p1  ORF type:complete len:251 (+),score=69.12 gb/GECH01013899.1/:1-753(+)
MIRTNFVQCKNNNNTILNSQVQKRHLIAHRVHNNLSRSTQLKSFATLQNFKNENFCNHLLNNSCQLLSSFPSPRKTSSILISNSSQRWMSSQPTQDGMTNDGIHYQYDNLYDFNDEEEDEEPFQKEIIEEGNQSSEKPKPGQIVTCHIKAGVVDGPTIDNTYGTQRPYRFRINSGRMIRGLDEGLKTMHVKEKSMFIFKPEYAFGITENEYPPEIAQKSPFVKFKGFDGKMHRVHRDSDIFFEVWLESVR